MFRLISTGWRQLWATLRVVGFAIAGLSLQAGCIADSSPVADNKQTETAALKTKQMVESQLAKRGIRDEPVLEAMGSVPRDQFVPPHLKTEAYDDNPLPIGMGQTISQPYVVAFMTEALKLKPTDRVLEVGTGSGYQAAVLAKLAREVYSIEIVEPLAVSARKRLFDLGYQNIQVRTGDGYRGWPDKAPFDAIMVTAAPDHVPQPLIDQLAPGGRLVLPVGSWYQSVKRLTRTASGIKEEDLLPVQFVPMTGEAREKQSK